MEVTGSMDFQLNNNNGGSMGDVGNHVNGGGGGQSPLSSPSTNGKSEVERIAALELLVSQQANEILCLKTAFGEVVRRLQEVESRPAATKSSAAASTKHAPASTRATTALPNKHTPGPTPAATPRPTSRTSLATSKKNVHSTENLHNTTVQSTTTTKTTKKIGNKEVAVEKTSIRYKVSEGEGLAKMYLKGRAVTMYAPSEQKQGRVSEVGKEPKESLALQWVFGYRGKDCRNNIVVVATGEICYFAAATAVLYNTETNKQRFYQQHTDDIKSIALHPDKVTVATGQVAGHAEVDGKPHVRVWNAESLQTLFVFGEGEFARGVCCLSFSKADGGQLLCAVDESNEHVVSIWDWNNSRKVTDQKGTQDPLSCIEWHPTRNNTLVMCGKSAVYFWSFSDNKLNKKSGLFEKQEKPKFITCCAFTEDGLVLTGDSNGHIFVWNCDDHKIKDAIPNAHDGPIFAACSMPNNCVLTGGSKDLTLSLFDMGSLSKLRDVSVLPENVGGVRQLAASADGNKVFVGTTRNCILQGPFHGEAAQSYEVAITSHFEELWGVCVHPTEPKFLTCGFDKLIVLWDSERRQPLWTKSVEYQLMCAAFHPSEPVAVFGTTDGKWFAMDLESREVLTLHPDSKEQFSCVAFSPDGCLMAIGSHDNGIYVYRVGEAGRKYSKVGKCIGHTSFVTHLDWSSDSQHLRTNSGDYEILYWSVANCKQNTDAQSMKDISWNSDTCVLGYNLIGIWPEGADGTDINGCDRSPDFNFVATADDFGKVKLYNYPCYTPKAACKVGYAHSSHVTRVRFLRDSRTLLSLGGMDCSVMVWAIE